MSSRYHMSRRNKVLFVVTSWAIIAMPVLFWWNTWFGRQLTDKQMTEYLSDDMHPRHIQHALVQLGDRMSRNDQSVRQWYPRLVQLASYKVDEVRNTDAWVMGQASTEATFHQALLGMLNDSSPLVRGNAALSLVRFGDSAGHQQIVSLLNEVPLTSPGAGKVVDAAAAGTAVREGGLVLKVDSAGATTEVRSPIAGRVRSVATTGLNVSAGTQVATLDPGEQQVWEALRALYLIGGPDDLPAIRPYTRESPDIPDHIRKQALETVSSIEKRASK